MLIYNFFVEKTSFWCKLLILCLIISNIHADTAENMGLQEEFAKKSNIFAIQLYHQLLNSKPNENLIFSPLSIQTCVAMARVGAVGQTAEELDRGLGLVSNDVPTIGEIFHQVLASYENSKILKIANKIYVMQGYTLKKSYQDIVTNKFLSAAEEINFADNAVAASKMNNWVETKTNNLIKNLIPSSAINDATRLVLLNAIHFKGEWVHKFPERATRDDDFYLNEVDTVKVPMMNLKGRFRYASLPELDATALEMPYKDSDLVMLVILPNSRTGLKALEDKLNNVDLADVVGKMYTQEVIIKFPKFKAELSVELEEPLKQMGMSRMFLGGEFSNMLEAQEPLRVSKVIHKAFIEVNEEGTEAAAATAVLMRKKRSLSYNEVVEFIAEHPFIYFIKHAKQVSNEVGIENHTTLTLFMGTVATFDGVVEAASNIMRDEL